MGSVIILILTGFVLACIHFNAKETARINAVAVEDDITRVQAQVTAVQTVYWTKEKVEGLVGLVMDFIESLTVVLVLGGYRGLDTEHMFHQTWKLELAGQ
jgi:hypothetical protein